MEIVKGEKIEIKKSFPVPKERLFKAWTDPEELKNWWHPMGNSLGEVKNDVRNNGAIRYEFGHSGKNSSITIDGEYLEVNEPDKLVYTWNWHSAEKLLGGGKFKLSVFFEDNDKGSRLCVEQENMENGDTLAPHGKGWEQSLQDLEEYLFNGNPERTEHLDYNG